MKPSGLAITCDRCGDNMPFDPQAQNRLCNACNRIIALGIDSSYQPSQHSRHDGTSTVMASCGRCGGQISLSTHHEDELCDGCNRILNLGGSSRLGMQEAGSGHEDSGDDGYTTTSHSKMASKYHPATFPSSPKPSTVSATLKRKNEFSVEEEYLNKRLMDNDYVPEIPSALRRAAWPPTFDARATAVAETVETDDEDGDQEFVDALESQEDDDQGVERGNEQSVEQADEPEREQGGDCADMPMIDAVGEQESVQMEVAGDEPRVEESTPEVTSEAPIAKEAAASSREATPAEQGDTAHESDSDGEPDPQPLSYDDDDLFAQTFGSKAANDDANDSDNEDLATPGGPSKIEEGEKDFDRANFITPLSSTKPSTTTTTSSKSKPKKKKPQPPKHQEGPLPILIPRDIGIAFRKQYTFHAAALHHLPRLPLAEHRYWIGVLRVGVPPRATQREKNFTWMKGNRRTTVETIWHAYRTRAIEEEDMVLLLGFERVDWGVRCEELDYFNDKRIILRAVTKRHPDAMGKGLAEELIKEVVTLDDDSEADDDVDRTRAPGAKGKGSSAEEEGDKGKEKRKEDVVIEID